MEVRKLRPEDDRGSFRSGNIDLDRFFQKYAGQNQFKHHVGTTYVAVEGGSILGFATIAVSHVEIDDLPLRLRRRLPRYPLPVLRLARLATHEAARGRGVGRDLLRAVLALATELRDKVGCIGIVVDAKEDARSFYARLGFEAMPAQEGALGDRPVPLPMFLPIAEVPETGT